MPRYIYFGKAEIMGTMLITVSKKDERTIRKLAETRYGGKKGSIGAAWHDAVNALVEREALETRRQLAFRRVMADMKEGFKLDLPGGRAYVKREDIYAERLAKQGLGRL